MSSDPRDPAYDFRVYCDRCLDEISEDDADAMGDCPDDWICPKCDRIFRPLTHAEAAMDRAIRRADWERDCMKDAKP